MGFKHSEMHFGEEFAQTVMHVSVATIGFFLPVIGND